MTYIRDTLIGLTPKQRSAFERRANALKKKAENLMAEALDVVDVEHRLTDLIDDVICTSENLASALAPPPRNRR